MLANEPLIHFHLPLVGYLPIGIDVDLAIFRRCLVVDDDNFSGRINPQIIDSTSDDQIRWRMMHLHTLKILTPFVDLWMLERHGVDAVLLHQRVGRRIYAMYVEFFLEQPVDEGIDVERWTGRAANAETVIDKKAARTFQIKFNAGPAHLERLIGSWVE